MEGTPIIYTPFPMKHGCTKIGVPPVNMGHGWLFWTNPMKTFPYLISIYQWVPSISIYHPYINVNYIKCEIYG